MKTTYENSTISTIGISNRISNGISNSTSANTLPVVALRGVAIVALVLRLLCNTAAPANAQIRPTPTTATLSRTPLYITFNTHNEEHDYSGRTALSTASRLPSAPISYEDRATFLTLRALVKEMADTVRSKGAKWDWQSDWRFLKGALAHDPQDVSTNRKNLVKWLAEDNGGAIEVDAHAHENDYNYADVAYLFDQLGVTVSPVVGGFTYNHRQGTNGGRDAGYTWDSLARGLQGRMYPSKIWTPTVLWGGASGTGFGTSHANDLRTLGIWKPQSMSNFFVHVSSNSLTLLGNGYPTIVDSTSTIDATVNSVVAVLDSIQRGLYPAGKFYSMTIDIHQKYYTSRGYIAKIAQIIDRLQPYASTGRLVWATHLEKVAVWQTRYASEPNFYPYTGGISSGSSSGSSSTSGSISAASIDARVYPNPASSSVTIELTGSVTNVRARLLHSSGAQVLSQTVSGSALMDVSAVANGFYVLELSDVRIFRLMNVVVRH
jgi:hypothetical protein